MLTQVMRAWRAADAASQRSARRAVAQVALAQPALDAEAVMGGFQSASPLVLKYQTDQGELYIGIDGPLQQAQPGNGGLRLWSYPSSTAAVAECLVLASTMTAKHAAYGTGHSGAKLVFNPCLPLERVDKRALMRDVAAALHELGGSVYTGCDLNTNLDDMEYLTELCPYVLASINAPTDPNIATGHGVFGSIKGALAAEGGVDGKSFFVKGTGKVGSVVAEQLVAAGAQRVMTYDANPSAADLPGCENMSGCDWRDVPCDVFVPCSVSSFIDEEAAARLRCRLVVGASNAPFSSPEALALLEDRGIIFVPEAVSSAGAVLADSIECFDGAAFRRSRAPLVYSYVRCLTEAKSRELIAAASRSDSPPSAALGAVAPPRGASPVGCGFSSWVRDRTSEVDVAIVGGGMAGAAAAWQLSKLAPGLKGVVMEASGVAHDGGSSYGSSRMYRQMYSDPYFSKMQSASLSMWGELEAESGQQLLKQNGLLFYGETDTGETVEGSVPGARAVMDQLGLPYTYYDSAAAMNAQWPMTSPLTYQGIQELTAGSIDSSNACAAMVHAARSAGSWQLREGDAGRIVDLTALGPNRVELLTSSGDVVRTRKVVLAAGAWTNGLLESLGGPELDLEVHAVQWGHYEVDKELAASFPQWFCFKKPAPGCDVDGGLYYGFPAECGGTGPDPVIKVGVDFTPNTPRHKTRSMAGFRYDPDPAVTSLIDSFLAAHWKGVGPRRDMRVSPYTMTRDSYFVLDRLPGQLSDVALFTGGNGRAFKFAPLLGRCLAELALERQPSYDISPFSVTREALQAKRGEEERQQASAAQA